LHLLVVDIDEQAEVIEIVQETLGSIQARVLTADIKVSSFQLKSRGYECDYDFSNLHSEPADLLLIHTKVFKVEGGDFLDITRWTHLMKRILMPTRARVYFYSGNIDDFKQWFQRNEITIQQNLLKTARCTFLDVFDLIYPPEESSFEQWLEQQLRDLN